jgi:hypothetical protein
MNWFFRSEKMVMNLYNSLRSLRITSALSALNKNLNTRQSLIKAPIAVPLLNNGLLKINSFLSLVSIYINI